MKKITIAIVAVMLLSLFSPLSIVSANYVVADNIVFVNDSNVYLSASPHTIYSSGWVYFNFTSKTYTGDIDAVWGFDRSTIKPTKAELYKPHWVNWTTNHSYFFYNVSNIELTDEPCEIGDSDSLYKRKITYQKPSFNYTTYETTYNTTSSVVCFDSYTTDGTNYTAYWTEDHSRIENWLDISSTFGKASLNHGGMNTWFYLKNIPVTAGTNYTIRAWVEVPVTLTGEYGKYWWAVKPSSETIGEAISSGHFYALDPWFNASWGKRRPIQINNTGNANDLDYYQVNINITYDSDMNSDFSDIRIVNDTADATVPYWIESKVDGSWANVWFNCTHIPASSWLNDTYYLYYNNSGATNASDGYSTFLFFDDFSDGDYTNNPTWTVVEGTTWTAANYELDTGLADECEIKTTPDLHNVTWRGKFKMGTTSASDAAMIVKVLDDDSGNWYELYCAKGGAYNFNIVTSSSGSALVSNSWTYDNEWHTYKLSRDSSYNWKYYLDGNLMGSVTNNTHEGSIFRFKAGQAMSYTAHTYWDNVIIQSFSPPEPTTTLGAEESPGPADTSFTVTLPAGYTYARFDLSGIAGGVAHDSSGNGNDGTIYGAKWVGDGLYFDGTDDYVNCGSDSSLDITEAITVMAWIHPIGWGEDNYGRIVEKHLTQSYKFYLYSPNGEKAIKFTSNDAGI
ncbi:hypothetical protein B6U67_01825, partial [Methanosarcinales archaeon ex4484_138]